MSRLFRRVFILPALIALAACAPAPTPAIPTALVLPSPVTTPVPTAVLPTITPLVPTRPPVLPTATRPTATITPTFTAAPPDILFESIAVDVDTLLVGAHDACLPATAQVRAVIRSVADLELVTLSWAYEGRVFRPGARMEQVARADWVGALGPFEQEGTVLYFITARDVNGAQALSDQRTLTVIPCLTPAPLATAYDGPATLTPTPPYGAAQSVRALDQQLAAWSGVPLPVTLTWAGGFPPYTLEVYPPQFGTLQGSGPAQIYTSNPDFTGQDRFTFRVTDSRGQASLGTIYIVVSARP